MKLAVIAFATLICTAVHANETQTFKNVDQFTLKNIQGEDKVTVSPDADLHIVINKVVFSDKCTLKVEQKGTAVEASVDKSGWTSHESDCQVNFTVQTPALKALSVDQMAGTIAIAGAKAEALDIRVVSAAVDANGEFAKSTIKSVSGKIGLKAGAKSQDIFLKSISGQLDLDTAAAKPKVEMVTVSGASFLKATPAPQVTFKSISGKMQSKVVGAADGVPVQFKSVSGNLTVQ